MRRDSSFNRKVALFFLIFITVVVCILIYRSKALEIERIYHRIGLYFQEKSLRNSMHHEHAIVGYPEKISFEESEELRFWLARNPSLPVTDLKSLKIHRAYDDQEVFYKKLKLDPLFPMICESYKKEGCGYRTLVKIQPNLDPGSYYIEFRNILAGNSDKIFFIVLPKPIGKYDFTIVYPNFTWHAYSSFGGSSFYDPNPLRKYKVSLNRPIRYYGGLEEVHGPYATVLFEKELRDSGYNVLPVSNIEIHKDSKYLSASKVLLINGHDEYWTPSMSENVKQFLSDGGRVLVMGGNTHWWRLKYLNKNLVISKGRPEFRDELDQGTGIADSFLAPQILFGASYRFAGYPLQRKVSEQTAIRQGLSKDDYFNAKGMNILVKNHPIFQNIENTNNVTFGQNIDLMDVEIDGLPLDRDLNIDRSRFSLKIKRNIIPENIKPLAWAWIFPYNRKQPIQKVSTINEYRPAFGGLVLNMGSIGWFKGLKERDDRVVQIIENSFKYMVDQKE